MRAALEALAARLAAEQMGAAELRELRELYDAMMVAARAKDAHEQSQADAAFHGAIARGARNATLERQWSFLEPFSRTYISVSQPGLNLLALSERHVPILEALRVRDADAAAEAMYQHLMDAADLLRPMAEKEIA